jgi:hypothetical protein
MPWRWRPGAPTPGQRVLLTHVHSYGRLSNLLSGGEYERLAGEVADSAFAAV